MKNLTQGNTFKIFFMFGIPLVFSGLLSQSYNIIDTMIAGKCIGEDGLAAVGGTAGLIQLTSSFMWGYSSGFCVYVAQMFGDKNYYGIKKCVIYNLLALLAVCILIGGGMLLFRRPLFEFLNVDVRLYRDTSLYFSIYISGLYFIILNDCFIKIFNAIGDSKMSFLMSCLAAVLNIGGNILSVAVLKMGVLGLVLASVISASVVDLCYYLRLLQIFRQMDVLHLRVGYDPAVLHKSVSYATPTSLQQITMYFSSAAVFPYINAIGASATAAYTVVIKIFDINACMYQGASMTVSNYTAQCVGGHKYHQLGKGLAVGAVLAAFCLIPLLILCALFPRQISLFFFDKGVNEDALGYAVLFMRYYLPFLVFNMINNLLHAFYRGVRATGLLILVTFIGAASRILGTLLLAPAGGMQGIYGAWVISWVAEAAITLILYFIGKWKPKELLNQQTVAH